MTGTRSQEGQERRAGDDRARAAFGPFDPLTTISELQAQGIRAASDIAGRLIDLLDPAASPARAAAPARNGDGRASVGDLRGAAGRLVDIYGDVLQRTFDAYADLLEERARMGAHLDGGPNGTVQIEIVCTADNHSGTGELWLGNGTDATAGALRLLPTALVSANGCVPAAGMVFDPAVVDCLAPGATTRVTVSIEIEPGTPSGYYHGYVLVPELPGEALPLTLLVKPPPGQDNAP
jgi:hypothetical protein